MYFSESLDEIYPIQRIKPHAPYILDEWHFEVGSNTHVIRVNKIPEKYYGKKVSIVTFGVKRGKTVGKRLEGISNIRKYLATVLSAIQKMNEDPTTKLKTKSDGFVLSMQSEVFEKMGSILQRIAKIKLRTQFKFHNSYFGVPSETEQNAIYMWVKEKPFSTVFSNLDVEDDSEETKDTVRDFVSSAITSRLETLPEPNEPVKVKEPVIDRQLSGVAEEVPLPSQKVLEARKIGEDLNERKADIRNYLKVLLVDNFFTRTTSYSKIKISVKAIIDQETFLDYVAYAYYKEPPIKILSSTEYLIALNIKGIHTDDVYDMYARDGHIERILRKNGIENTPDIPETPRVGVTIDEAVDICLDARNILMKNGVDLNKKKLSYHFNKSISANKTLDYLIHGNNQIVVTNETKLKLFSSVLASADPSVLDNFDPFKYEESSKGTKMVKGRKYTYDDKTIDIVMDLKNMARSIATTPEEYLELVDKLPYYAQGMNTVDTEYFEVNFISNWCLMGGSTAQIATHHAFDEHGANAELNSFYNEVGTLQEHDRDVIEASKDRYNSHFVKLYERSQEYYSQKYKKSYDKKTIKLYRGVGIKVVDSYVPGAVESWTSTVSTAVKFGKMMADRDENYTVLMAEVPIQDIFGSWDSFAETWPGEEDLKGKKEYMVMGGTFATTPIYVYDHDTKEAVGELKPFKEWIEMKEAKETKKDAIKIVTPDMKSFSNAIKSGKAAFGNDPKENEARKSDNHKE